MILMIYINDSNIFILIYPCYIYFFIDFIALCYVSGFHAASSMSWYLSFMYANIVLYAFKYLYDDTYARTYILYIFTYLIYAFIWHLLSALHTFYGSNAALLLYDTHSFCELALVLSFATHACKHIHTYTM